MPPVSTKNKTSASHLPTDNAFRELIRVFGLVERVMQPYFAQFGISGAQWSVLRNLHRAEQEGHAGLRLTDLGERLLVRPPSVTGVVDRLEKVGLVARDGVPEDLRAKQVVLTDKGRRILERVLAAHQEQLDAVMSGLAREEQAELHRLLGKLGRHLDGMLGADTN
jgi:DNA-binding MarR family transcriptional regulator